MFWGLTPVLDLLEEFESTNKDLPDHLNILIVGGSDSRHVLQTLAKKYRHKNIKLNFYLIDACVESIARQLLLLTIALQPQEALGLDQKTKIFMELYGNSLIRPSVAKFLISTAKELVKIVTNYDYLNEMLSCINLDIKYKERDYLENLLKFWSSKDDFNITESWDRRVRQMLGVRYDSKLGAFDWDLHMRLHHVGGKQVCNQEYRNFRLNGVAFSWLESEVSKPNRSLVCAVLQNGKKFLHHGYLGDIQTGPFVTFGLNCEDKNFVKSSHGENSYRATDITERNLKQIFYELQNQKEYNHVMTSDVRLGSLIMKQDKLVVDIRGVDVLARTMKRSIELDDKINFLSISRMESMKYKEDFHNFFHIIYFGNSYLKYFDKATVSQISTENAMLILEHQLFVLSHRNKQLDDFGKLIADTIDGMKVDKIDFNPQTDAYAKFVLRQNQE